MEALPLFVRLAGQAVIVLGEGDAADAKRRLVEEAGGRAVDAAGPGTRIAFVAEPDPARAATLAEALRASGHLVNVVDQPALCDFTVPAIVDRSPLLLAIGTLGASASLAKAVKERLEWMLSPGLGAMAVAIRASRRAVAAVHRDVSARRAFWAGLLAPGAPLDPFGPAAEPQAAIDKALEAPAAPDNRLDVITLGPGGVDALTLAQLRLLAQADLVLLPRHVPPALLALIRRDSARLVADHPPEGMGGRIVRLQSS